jgi:6-pyruvoyltetrahydropterin/6-carboxytetrahydropterin synthase
MTKLCQNNYLCTVMYTVIKTLEISAAHSLSLDYGSKCENLHGHNWRITVYCRAKELDANGMVTDFTSIKKEISDKLDHKYINDVLPFNPTAENIARWVCERIPNCYRVEVAETADNVAVYEKD